VDIWNEIRAACARAAFDHIAGDADVSVEAVHARFICDAAGVNLCAVRPSPRPALALCLRRTRCVDCAQNLATLLEHRR